MILIRTVYMLEERHENRDSRYVKPPCQQRRKYIATLELRFSWGNMGLANYDSDTDGSIIRFVWVVSLGRELRLPVLGGNNLTIVADKAVADDEMEFVCIVTQVFIGS